MNFAIIGCGRIAPRHAESIRQIPDANLVAVCDKIPERARFFAERYGAEAYTDYHELLARTDIDIVNVCVPSGLHVAVGKDVARAHKHLLVEKPIAMDVAGADALIRTCEEEGICLGVVLQNRFNPPMQDLRRLVDDGKMGRLLLGNATVRWFRPQSYYEDGWHGTWSMDGGVLLNQAIHHVDALIWMMGEVETVNAYMDTLAHQIEVPDVGVAILRFKSGGVATIEASTFSFPQNIEGSVALFGEKGSVKVGGTALNRKVFWKVDGMLELERDMLAREAVDPPSVYGYSHRTQILEMMAAVKENRAPMTSGYEALRSLAVVLAIHESARTGKEIRL